MSLGRRRIGELVALVGVVLGLVALFLHDFEGSNAKYADDGTFLAALIVVLGLAACCLLASLLLGKANLDLTAAVAGAAAFGFFLYSPAVFAFEGLDKLSWGVWLGVCTGLIPLGAGAAQIWHRRSDAKAPGMTLTPVAATIGLVLIVIGIWSNVLNNLSTTYWDNSASGHALGLLLLLLAIVSAILIANAVEARKAELADLALIVSTITVGLAATVAVFAAFGSLGSLGTGAWLELAGGLVLVISLIASRVTKPPKLEK